MSCMVAYLEPGAVTSIGQRLSLENLPSVEQNLRRGKVSCPFQVSEWLCATYADGGVMTGSLLPKLSEKEQVDRANVILPFEHLGNGKPIEILAGWRSVENKKNESVDMVTGTSQIADSSKGEIIILWDSDDEMPESDESPDDDLHIKFCCPQL